MAGLKCDKCGVENAPGMERCGSCDSLLSGEERESVDRPRTAEITPVEYAFSDIAESAFFTMAINIRRVFVVLLAFLVISTIEMILTLYLLTVDDVSNFRLAVLLAIAGGVVVAIACIWYAIFKKRLSE